MEQIASGQAVVDNARAEIAGINESIQKLLKLRDSWEEVGTLASLHPEQPWYSGWMVPVAVPVEPITEAVVRVMQASRPYRVQLRVGERVILRFKNGADHALSSYPVKELYTAGEGVVAVYDRPEVVIPRYFDLWKEA